MGFDPNSQARQDFQALQQQRLITSPFFQNADEEEKKRLLNQFTGIFNSLGSGAGKNFVDHVLEPAPQQKLPTFDLTPGARRTIEKPKQLVSQRPSDTSEEVGGFNKPRRS